MTSLKAFTQKMDKLTGASEDRLYERVRSLVRIGVLRPIPGRGPGRGTPLNASNLSALIVSMLATDNWGEIDTRVARLCDAVPSPGPTCPFTGATSFRGALAEIITSTKRAKLTLYLSVQREALEATIGFRARRRAHESHFRPSRKQANNPFISTTTRVSSSGIQTIAGLLQHELLEGKE